MTDTRTSAQLIENLDEQGASSNTVRRPLLVRDSFTDSKTSRTTSADYLETYLDGKTMVWNTVGNLWPFAAALDRAWTSFFGMTVMGNAYVTPRGAQGFPPHADHQDVVICQLYGRKTWRLYDMPHALPFGHQTYGKPTTKYEPAKRIRPKLTVEFSLEAGDVLYVPRGWIHDCETGDEAPSAHWTLSLVAEAVTWGRLLDMEHMTTMGDADGEQPSLSVMAARRHRFRNIFQPAVHAVINDPDTPLLRHALTVGWSRRVNRAAFLAEAHRVLDEFEAVWLSLPSAASVDPAVIREEVELRHAALRNEQTVDSIVNAFIYTIAASRIRLESNVRGLATPASSESGSRVVPGLDVRVDETKLTVGRSLSTAALRAFRFRGRDSGAVVDSAEVVLASGTAVSVPMRTLHRPVLDFILARPPTAPYRIADIPGPDTVEKVAMVRRLERLGVVHVGEPLAGPAVDGEWPEYHAGRVAAPPLGIVGNVGRAAPARTGRPVSPPPVPSRAAPASSSATSRSTRR